MSSAEKDVVVVIPTNNPGRVMLFAALNPQLDEVITMKPISEYGGFSGEAFRKLSPAGLCPIMVTAGGMSLCESDVILRYIADKYQDKLAVTCEGKTPEERALSNQICALHNMYFSGVNCTQPNFFSNQACIYKTAMGEEERQARLKDLHKQLDLFESLVVGPFATGETLTFADVTLYPTLQMFHDCATRSILGSPAEGRPKLAAWMAHCSAQPGFRGVADQLSGFVNNVLGKNIDTIKEKFAPPA